MKKQNFNLVEVIIAMGIVVVCITTIMGMFSVGLKASKDAVFRSYANNIVEQIGGMVETHPSATNAVPDTEPYTATTADIATASTKETACATAIDEDDPFFKDVYYGADMNTLKVVFKTSVNSALAEDFTAYVKLWWDSSTRDIDTSDGTIGTPQTIELDDSKTLNIEVTWPHHIPYIERVLLGNQMIFQKVMRP